MDRVLNVGLFSFATSMAGLLVAYIVCVVYSKKSVRQRGFFLGLTGGVLISIICFELLPEAIVYTGMVIPMTTMTIALVVCAYLEHAVINLKDKTGANGVIIVDEVNPLDLVKISTFAGVVIGLNNFPEGLALGTVLLHTEMREAHMIYALFLHSVIEGMLVFSNTSEDLTKNITKKASNRFANMQFIIVTSFIIGVSAILGAFLTNISHVIMPLSVGFVSGIMLYTALGETIPKSRAVWNGRFSTLGACVGVVIGIVVNGL